MKNTLSLKATILYAICLLALVACGNTYGTKLTPTVGAGTDAKQAKGSTTTPTTASSMRVSVIDVGKGDCILLQAGNESALIDTGYKSTATDVLSHLRAQGIGHLDAVVITHYDRDHVDGLRTIGESVSVGTVYLPAYEGADKNYRSCISSVKALDVATQRVTKELVLSIGNARMTLFPSGVTYEPGTGKAEGNDNDMSLVATLVNDDDSYLFAGDLEEDGIAAYLASNHATFDVLKMPHHGRHASNTSELLDNVRPQIAVITDAKEDPADKKTLKLLKAADVDTYRTSADGTVVIESDGSGTYDITSA